ncbi:MAG: hypothetical protein Fur007_08030 [Rhodoferax sp.]
MDESAYQSCRQSSNPAPCVFEKAVLAGCVGCSLANRLSLAEREVVACQLPIARINCATLAALLRERATFALHLPPPSQPIAHAKSMQLQCGGLRGLQVVLDAAHMDVHALVQQAQQDGQSLLDLPWADMLGHVMQWNLRAFRHGRN